MKFALSVVLSLVFSGFIFVSGCLAMGNEPESGGGPLTEIRYFELEDLNGRGVSLEALLKENKAVLISFWATWCPPCREEIPYLMGLQEKYQGSSFTVLGVDVGESKGKVARFVKNAGMNYPIVLDRDTRIAIQYKVLGIPYNILVRSDGQILGQYYGFTDQLVADVEAALNPSPTQSSQS